MNNEQLVVVNAISQVSSALNSLITSYRGTRKANQMQLQMHLKLAEDKIHECISKQRIQIFGEVERTALNELFKTMDMLNKMNLQGPMADYAMRTIESMQEGLLQVLDDLKRKHLNN